MPDLTELDRLIEEGLTLYGAGDLDGALLVWEQALSMDPENAQANSYVDYVRMNYEMLTTDAGNDESAPFGIAEDEPEYQIEIMPGEVDPKPAGAPMYMDPTDEGWFMDSEPQRQGDGAPSRLSEETLDKQIETAPKPMTLELDADEPSPPPPPTPEPTGVNFEDATREYQPSPAQKQAKVERQVAAHDEAINELFAPEGPTTEFQPEGTPGFEGLTDVRKRDFGFVKPTDPKPADPPPTPDPEGLPPPPSRPRRPSQAPPELKMTLRTPTQDESREPPPATGVSLSYEQVSDDDLISSLPVPTPLSPRPGHTTRDLPSDIVPPSMPAPPVRMSLDSFDVGEPELPLEISVSFNASHSAETPTRELPGARDTSTRDFTEKPTQEITQRPPLDDNPLVSAPTRELGLRPPGTRANTEDEPTGAKPPLDPRAIAAAMAPDGTRADIVLPFDPIDARSAQILDDVDHGAPTSEPKEERTRRRITTLLERAAEWSKGSELDRAVAAVDLALSEDPNSALAQKLIHRNRDTIMSVFQGFLGDLNRTPVLARPLHELGTAPISPRAAFLLSRIDGALSLDEILDVSGMPRLEAYRYLCQLFLRGILR